MQTAECDKALEQVSAYLENPDLHHAELQAALSHIRACPYCAQRIGHLIRALTTEEADGLSCQECQDHLPDYLVAEANQQADAAQWHPVALHLQTCPHCSAAYATLAHLTELAEGRRGVEPAHYPIPRLPFLQDKQTGSPQTVRIPWRWDEGGRLVIEFSAELLQTLQSSTQQPAYATERHKAGRSPRIIYQFSLKDAAEDLEVTMTAELAPNTPAQCVVIVEVMIPSRGGWPHLAGTEVTLRRDDQELGTHATDAYGKAVFAGVAVEDLPRLVCEIQPVV
jgi:hypothetical protein